MLLRLAPILAALALLAGCGDTKTVVRTVTTSANAARLTKPQLIARVNAECREFRALSRKFDALDAEIKREHVTTVEQLRDVLRNKIAPPVRRAVGDGRVILDRMRALTPPAADRTTYARFIVLYDRSLALADSAADAMADGDVNEVERITDSKEADALKAERNGIARAYGFRTCISKS